MNNRLVVLTSLIVVLLLASSIGGQSLSAYAARNTPPSFSGGTFLKYHDGLKVNGQVIDISRYIQNSSLVIPDKFWTHYSHKSGKAYQAVLRGNLVFF